MDIHKSTTQRAQGVRGLSIDNMLRGNGIAREYVQGRHGLCGWQSIYEVTLIGRLGRV